MFETVHSVLFCNYVRLQTMSRSIFIGTVPSFQDLEHSHLRDCRLRMSRKSQVDRGRNENYDVPESPKE